MKDLALFGTSVYPIHPSGIRGLITCPWKTTMRYLEEPEEAGGVPGDTGSATHVAVAEFHRGREPAACIEAMSAKLAKYPNADLQDAAGLFLKYISDPRNRDARVVLIERTIQFSIEAAPEDRTGARIEVMCTVDQVRDVDGKLAVYDLKTSKKDGIDLVYQHLYQVAAYCVGASIALNTTVHPGALILPRKYRDREVSTAPVFWHFPWKFEDIEQILMPLRHAVANIRAGRIWHVPHGEYCMWCPMKTPDVCLPKLQQLKVKLEQGS